MSDLRALIMAANDRKIEPVEMPEWGVTVYVRTLSAAEYESYMQQIVEKKVGFAARELLIFLTVCDESGKLVFNKESDLEIIGQKNDKAIQRLYEECQRVNKLSKPVQELLEEAKKN